MTSLLFSNNDVISSDFPKKLKKNPKKTQCSATAVAPSFQEMAERESLLYQYQLIFNVTITARKERQGHCFLNRFTGKLRHSPSLLLSFSSAHLAGAQLNLFQNFLTLYVFDGGTHNVQCFILKLITASKYVTARKQIECPQAL